MKTPTQTFEIHDTAVVRSDVDRILQAYYSRQAKRAAAVDPAYGMLWQSMQRLMAGGGKRLRPYLLVLAYEMYGGRDYEAVLPVAAAQELLHQSLLIHDDITDKDTMRYGMDNVSGEYVKRYAKRCLSPEDVIHYAESAALLSGDLLLSAAQTMVLESGLPMEHQLLAHSCITDAVFAVAGGQLLDMEGGMQLMRETDPFKIARLKTASYSFIAPLKCGAQLAGAPEADIKRLIAFGEGLGVAYQLADDLLGIFGDEAVTGKSNLTDLQEGKHTYLMQLTFRQSTPEQLAEVQKYFGRHDLDEAQADVVRAIVIDCGAKAGVEAKLEQYRAEAVAKISELRIPDEARQRLDGLINGVTRRER